MAAGQGGDIVHIAPADDTGDRQARPAQGCQHQMVARRDSRIGQCQLAQPVRRMDIDPGVIKGQVIGPGRQSLAQGRGERVEIGLIAGARGQTDVEIALLLPDREIGAAMQGQGEDRRIAGKDGGGAVALMHVAIDDQGPANRPFRLQGPNRHRDIVENAEAGA